MACDWSRETHWRTQGYLRIAGIDEAGRGPLAGPVVVAAVIFRESFALQQLDDSKKLAATTREQLYETLTGDGRIEWAVAVVDPPEIDRLNILGATHAGMRRAIQSLADADFALIDGLPVRDFPTPQEALVKGDGRSYSIAAASILAKVTRDRLMIEAATRYPEYGFEQHKGYPTPHHLAMLGRHGPCQIHRHSFGPVAQLALFPQPDPAG